ncbi:hypothetical protein BDF22DRAFT_304429 [Syncephalis plumigaleata]|nr:hypothetical protein BDF22DRAFT_304429 [Syncephalis plumigaleata]
MNGYILIDDRWEPEEHMANCEELLEKFWNENDNHNLMRRREKYIREWARTMNVHPPKFLFDEVQPIKTEGVDVITPSITSTDIGKGKTKKAKKTPTTATKQSTKKKVESVHKTATATATTTAKRGKKEDKEDSSQATKHSSDISHSTPTHQSSLASSSTNVDASHTTVSDVLSNITTPTLTPRQKEKMPEFIPTISSDEEEEHDDDDDDVVVVQKPAKKRAKLDKSISRVGAGDKAKAMQPIDLSTPPSASHNYYATSTMPSTTISIESDSSIISNFDYRIPKRVRDTNTDTETAHEQAVTSSRDILVVPDDEISTMAISTSGHATPKPQYTTTSNASAAVSGKSSLLDSVMERISSTSNTSNTTQIFIAMQRDHPVICLVFI